MEFVVALEGSRWKSVVVIVIKMLCLLYHKKNAFNFTKVINAF